MLVDSNISFCVLFMQKYKYLQLSAKYMNRYRKSIPLPIYYYRVTQLLSCSDFMDISKVRLIVPYL